MTLVDSRQRTALITGARGQDGWYLTQHLTKLGYEVIGTSRSIADSAKRIACVDLADPLAVNELIAKTRPDQCYHLAAHHHSSHSKYSHTTKDELREDYSEFYRANTLSTFNLLTSLHQHRPDSRFFFAGSAHLYGSPEHLPQNESTPFRADSFYSITKEASMGLCRMFRTRLGYFASCGILFNHESSRRPDEFVSKMICKAVAQIKRAESSTLVLGNLDAEADWGYAGDTVVAMERILHLPTPEDFVIATGVRHTIRDFVQIAFDHAGLNWKHHVEVDPTIIRKEERKPYIGDPAKLMEKTDWRPSLSFEEMIQKMVDFELGER